MPKMYNLDFKKKTKQKKHNKHQKKKKKFYSDKEGQFFKNINFQTEPFSVLSQN